MVVICLPEARFVGVVRKYCCVLQNLVALAKSPLQLKSSLTLGGWLEEDSPTRREKQLNFPYCEEKGECVSPDATLPS